MNMKKLVGIMLAIGILGVGAVTYAAGFNTPAEIVADLTGESVESVMSQRSAGTSYGAMAAEAGLLSEFHEKTLALKKEVLEQRVQAGQMTEEEAASIYATLQNKQANGRAAGQRPGFGFGFGGMGHMGRGQQGQLRGRNGFCPGFGW